MAQSAMVTKSSWVNCFVCSFQIYESVLFFHGTSEIEFEARWKSFHAVKRALEDKVRGFIELVQSSYSAFSLSFFSKKKDTYLF